MQDLLQREELRYNVPPMQGQVQWNMHRHQGNLSERTTTHHHVCTAITHHQADHRYTRQFGFQHSDPRLQDPNEAIELPATTRNDMHWDRLVRGQHHHVLPGYKIHTMFQVMAKDRRVCWHGDARYRLIALKSTTCGKETVLMA